MTALQPNVFAELEYIDY